MKKWVLTALAYLIVVVGSYYAYTAIASPPVEEEQHTDTEQHNE
ncbi:hypothetical protein ACTNDN_05860 [Niallia sp. HCP3S3_B10]|uniref:Uncharacterized protein n=1 Tax=Niallia hominis TaxID=3133173 RepID=A0ABV1F0U3_9BACI